MRVIFYYLPSFLLVRLNRATKSVLSEQALRFDPVCGFPIPFLLSLIITRAEMRRRATTAYRRLRIVAARLVEAHKHMAHIAGDEQNKFELTQEQRNKKGKGLSKPGGHGFAVFRCCEPGLVISYPFFASLFSSSSLFT